MSISPGRTLCAGPSWYEAPRDCRVRQAAPSALLRTPPPRQGWPLQGKHRVVSVPPSHPDDPALLATKPPCSSLLLQSLRGNLDASPRVCGWCYAGLAFSPGDMASTPCAQLRASRHAGPAVCPLPQPLPLGPLHGLCPGVPSCRISPPTHTCSLCTTSSRRDRSEMAKGP